MEINKLNITSKTQQQASPLTRKSLLWAFLGQLVMVLMAGVFFCFFSGMILASFLIGALILMLANFAFFLRFFFMTSNSNQPQQHYAGSNTLRRFYWGALLKWAVLIIGFYLAFKFNLILWAFVVGLAWVLMSFYASIFFSGLIRRRLWL